MQVINRNPLHSPEPRPLVGLECLLARRQRPGQAEPLRPLIGLACPRGLSEVGARSAAQLDIPAGLFGGFSEERSLETLVRFNRPTRWLQDFVSIHWVFPMDQQQFVAPIDDKGSNRLARG